MQVQYNIEYEETDVYCIGGQVRVCGQGEGQPVRELGRLQARHPTQTDLNIMLIMKFQYGNVPPYTGGHDEN